jgi:tetratricopeptide (TPR) repeat protein
LLALTAAAALLWHGQETMPQRGGAALLWHGLPTMPQPVAAAEPPAKPTKEQIAKWVQQLGDDDFAVREEASKKLYEAGQPAEEALQEAARSDDAEVARRAGDILDRFKWGLYPDAPKKVVELVGRYRAADANGKEAVIRDLLDAGPSGYRTLLKIAAAEPDPAIRGRVFGVVTQELSHAAPQLLADENYDTLELLLDVVLANEPELGVGHYASYWLMRGKLDDRIAHFKALAAKGVDAPQNWEIVSRLCHAKGDLAAAREAAEKAGKPELADALLFEAGDWKTLAQRPAHSESGLPYEALGFQAAYRRLAGDAKGCDDALAELRKLAGGPQIDEYERFHFAKVLFLNDRPAEAIDVLAQTPGRQAIAFEALAAQMRYKAALELADKAKAANGPDAAALEILKARLLYQLGDKDKATAIFAHYGDEIKPGVEATWFETLVDSEARVGLKDQAGDHAAKILSTSKDQGWAKRLFAKLFPKKGEAAEAVWQLLAERPDGTPASNMKDLRSLLDGNAKAEMLKDVADRAAKTVGANVADVSKRLLGAAEAALACKDEKLALSLLEKAGKDLGSADALIRLGDLEVEKKEWDKAAERYKQAWDKEHAKPMALYLSGWALAQAGQEKEGKKRMDLSHWMPLGDGQARVNFLRSLADRGHRAAARREGELLLRLSTPGSYFAAEGTRQASVYGPDHKDFLAAAEGQERSMLRCLNRDVYYLLPAAYLGVPALVHRYRAEGYTAAGKFDEARKEVALGLAALPGDTFFPIELVPAWDKAGHKQEASELFDRCLAAQEQVCRDYPDCPWAHNSVAWLSACCRRNLDSGLDHALKATTLAPTSAGNLDTLSEIYFQRGEKEKAVAAEKKAIELDPNRAYFHKQLKRIEAGDPAADRPPETDDDE